MRLVKPKFEIINRDNTTYLKSKTVFINRYIHPEDGEEEEYNPLERYCLNKHSKVKDDGDNYYITTSIEVLVENGWESDLKYICDPTKYHEKRLTVKFICSNNFYNLLTSKYWYIVRNFSISKDTNIEDEELIFIIPCWLDIPEGKAYWHDGINYRVGATEENPFGESVNPKAWFNKESNCVEVHDYIQALDNAEKAYFRLMSAWENRVTDRRYVTGFKGNPWTPQQARAILPNSLKTELVMTGFESNWKKLFNVVKDEELKELLDPLKEEFIKNNYYINE